MLLILSSEIRFNNCIVLYEPRIKYNKSEPQAYSREATISIYNCSQFLEALSDLCRDDAQVLSRSILYRLN